MPEPKRFPRVEQPIRMLRNGQEFFLCLRVDGVHDLWGKIIYKTPCSIFVEMESIRYKKGTTGFDIVTKKEHISIETNVLAVKMPKRFPRYIRRFPRTAKGTK